jgi:general secretion pathway protein F
MPTFRYRAYRPDGAFAEGTVEAATSDDANEALWMQGLTPFHMLATAQAGTKWWNRELAPGRSPRADVLAFTHQFSMLVAADVPLDDALRILQVQVSSPRLRALVDGLLGQVLNGLALSEAMQKQAPMFSDDYIAVVRAGELGGTLAEVLTELAELLERQEEIRTRIRSALTYPCMLVVLSLGTLAIIVGGLVPSIAPIFNQSGKPTPAGIQFMLALRDNWSAIAFASAFVILLTWTALAAVLRKPEARQGLDRFLLRLPVLGGFLLRREAARFARTLGTMLKAGVSLIPAAKAAGEVIRNRHISAGIDRAIEEVRQGAALHRALQAESDLPTIALQMISVGEEAGKLDRMLTRIAVMFERELQSNIDSFMSILTPALTVGIALLVGALILPVMNAVLSINDLAAR